MKTAVYRNAKGGSKEPPFVCTVCSLKEKRLESMQYDINACKMTEDTVEILIRKIDQLEKRIEELERKTA